MGLTFSTLLLEVRCRIYALLVTSPYTFIEEEIPQVFNADRAIFCVCKQVNTEAGYVFHQHNSFVYVTLRGPRGGVVLQADNYLSGFRVEWQTSSGYYAMYRQPLKGLGREALPMIRPRT